jgi:hypothetical protein
MTPIPGNLRSLAPEGLDHLARHVADPPVPERATVDLGRHNRSALIPIDRGAIGTLPIGINHRGQRRRIVRQQLARVRAILPGDDRPSRLHFRVGEVDRLTARPTRGSSCHRELTRRNDPITL